MKTISQRSDVVVVGSGLAGICAAVSAARKGAIVRLIESRPCLGGRISKEVQFPYDFEWTSNYAYQRETGVLEEIMSSVFKENHEGNYCGQERALINWISKEERLEIFLETHLFEVKKSVAGDKIESIVAISNELEGRVIFRASYFIDCSETGVLCQLSEVPGEIGLDQSEYQQLSSSGAITGARAASSMQIGISDIAVPFKCPSWVSLRWEDNHQAAQIDLMESLSRGIEGVHNVEWLGKSKNESRVKSADLVWASWDYLKNRSPLVNRAENWVIEGFSPVALNTKGFRAKGEYILTPEDMESANSFYDSVALGRSPLDVADSLLSSPRGKVALPQPFEIPLRSLFSDKIKNLFFAGEHVSATSRASASFSHPPTSAQMGEAVGVCAALCKLKRRLPRTMAKLGNVDVLRTQLNRLNHTCSLLGVEDSDNLIIESKVIASTTLETFSAKSSLMRPSSSLQQGLIQFPVSTNKIDEVFLYLESQENCNLQIRLFENASGVCTIPGACLASINQTINEGGPRWEKIRINASVNKSGWHFIEYKFDQKIILYEQLNAPVGLLWHQPIKSSNSGLLNPYSEYFPKLPSTPSLATVPVINISPAQTVYDSRNLKNEGSRPNSLPNLWVSEETNFQYPEYIEFHWDNPVDISTIEIVWDTTLEYLYPIRPQPFVDSILPSIVKDYKIYSMNDVGHWEELLEVNDNENGFSSHDFDHVKTRAIEIEISGTHGLNRAQVYQVRAYS
ncbi:MAG: FAD-dependent oxidoreductase [Opitutae bacterium]|nr:FAD-dependent oxidoreductase [Opitutae bacterium]